VAELLVKCQAPLLHSGIECNACCRLFLKIMISELRIWQTPSLKIMRIWQTPGLKIMRNDLRIWLIWKEKQCYPFQLSHWVKMRVATFLSNSAFLNSWHLENTFNLCTENNEKWIDYLARLLVWKYREMNWENIVKWVPPGTQILADSPCHSETLQMWKSV